MLRHRHAKNRCNNQSTPILSKSLCKTRPPHTTFHRQTSQITHTENYKTNLKYPYTKLAVVDISPFLGQSSNDTQNTSSYRQNAIDQVTTSLKDDGFFYIKGNPTLLALSSQIHKITSEFIKYPTAIKNLSRTPNTRRGYHHFEGSPNTFTHEEGNETTINSLPILSKVSTDKIEAFTMQSATWSDKDLMKKYMSNDHESDGEGVNIDSIPKLALPPGVYLNPAVIAAMVAAHNPQQHAPSSPGTSTSSERKNVDTNRWPKTPHERFNADFKRIYQEYYRECTKTCEAIIKLLSASLNIDPTQLLSRHASDNHTLESKYYPSIFKDDSVNHNNVEVDKNADTSFRLRFPVHSDLTTLTLLTQTHQSGGLMIYNRKVGWQLVHNGEDTNDQGFMLVNIGDFLSTMTGGEFHSSLHCVANINDIVKDKANYDNDDLYKPRLSTVFFYMPDYEAEIHNLIQQGDGSQKIPSFQAGDKYPVFCEM